MSDSFVTIGGIQRPIIQWRDDTAVDLTMLGVLREPLLPEVYHRSTIKRFLLQHDNALEFLNQTCSNLPAGITLEIVEERLHSRGNEMKIGEKYFFTTCQIESDEQGMLKLDVCYSALKGNALYFDGQGKISQLILRPDENIEFKTNGTFSSLEGVVISVGIPGDKTLAINKQGPLFYNSLLPTIDIKGINIKLECWVSPVHSDACNLDWLKNAPSVKKLLLNHEDKPVLTEPLSNLEELFVFNCKVDSTFLSHVQMSVMKKLMFFNCGLNDFPHEINQAKKLELLGIHCDKFDNQSVIQESPIVFDNLIELECLHLTNNDFGDNELDFGSLNKLKQLNLFNCNLNKFPKGLEKLNQLQDLNLGKTVALNALETLPVLAKLHQISYSDLGQIGKLTQLAILNLSSCCLTKIPDSIFQLPRLENLDISHNHLRELPETVTEMMRKKLYVSASDNWLEKPPQAICNDKSLHCETILKYFEDIKKFEEIHSNRLRVSVLGNSTAGKTSLINALLCGVGRPEPEKERTSGIEVRTFYANLTDDSPLELDMWDYAGHDSYQTLHNFYLRNGSLFILVVDTFVYEMTDESYFEHVGRWIEDVRAQILRPVFLVVANKIDKFEHDTEALENKCQHMVKKIAEQERQVVESIQADISAHPTDRSDITKLQILKKSRPVLPDTIYDFNSQSSDQSTKLVLCSAEEISCTNVNGLHQELIRVSFKFFPFLNCILPKLWKDIGNQLIRLKETPGSKKYVSIGQLDAWLSEQCPEYRDDDDRESTLGCVLDYLVTIGKVLQFIKIPGLRNLVFFDPDWLNSLLREVVRYDLDTFVQYHSDFINYSMDQIQFENEKRNLTQRGLVSRRFLCCVWHKFSKNYNIPFGELLALSSLLENFNIGYKMTDKEAEIEGHDYENDYILIPSLMPDEPPSGVKDEWPESCPDDKLEISCRYIFHSNVLTGLFELLMCRVLKGADYQVHWKHGFYSYVGKVRFHVRKEPNQKRATSVVIRARIEKAESRPIHCIWEAILKIHLAFYALEREWWPWLRYTIYNHCPECNADHHNFNFRELLEENPAVAKTLRCCGKKFPPELVENPTLVYPSAETIEEFRRENGVTIARKGLPQIQGPGQENTNTGSENVEVFKGTFKKEFSQRLEKCQQNAERCQEGRYCNVLANIIITTVLLIGAVILALVIGEVFNIVAGIVAFAASLTITVYVLCVSKRVQRKKILSDEFELIRLYEIDEVTNEWCRRFGQNMPKEIKEAEKLAKITVNSMFTDTSYSTSRSICSFLDFGCFYKCCRCRANYIPVPELQCPSSGVLGGAVQKTSEFETHSTADIYI